MKPSNLSIPHLGVVLIVALSLGLIALPVGAATTPVDLGASAKVGTPPMKSIGPLAFGPDGVLFAADSQSAAIFAIDTGDSAREEAKPLDLERIDAAIASLLGTERDQIRIHDLAVNPLSHKIYLSVSRGLGPDAAAVIVRVTSGGTPELLDLDKVNYAQAELPNPVSEETRDRRGNSLRQEAITDLAFVDDTLLVTGLSNEEFSSNLRTLAFPFTGVSEGTSVEVFHGAHGKWETHAPIRTLTLYETGTAAHVLAAYTCTPLVRFPLADLAESQKLTGTTVAELGNRNRPLDMIVYQMDAKDYLLMANSSRGVMKVGLEQLEDIDEITEPVSDKAGLTYDTIEGLDDVVQLDRYGQVQAVILQQNDEGARLRSIDLP